MKHECKDCVVKFSSNSTQKWLEHLFDSRHENIMSQMYKWIRRTGVKVPEDTFILTMRGSVPPTFSPKCYIRDLIKSFASGKLTLVSVCHDYGFIVITFEGISAEQREQFLSMEAYPFMCVNEFSRLSQYHWAKIYAGQLSERIPPYYPLPRPIQYKRIPPDHELKLMGEGALKELPGQTQRLQLSFEPGHENHSHSSIPLGSMENDLEGGVSTCTNGEQLNRRNNAGRVGIAMHRRCRIDLKALHLNKTVPHHASINAVKPRSDCQDKTAIIDVAPPSMELEVCEHGDLAGGPIYGCSRAEIDEREGIEIDEGTITIFQEGVPIAHKDVNTEGLRGNAVDYVEVVREGIELMFPFPKVTLKCNEFPESLPLKDAKGGQFSLVSQHPIALPAHTTLKWLSDGKLLSTSGNITNSVGPAVSMRGDRHDPKKGDEDETKFDIGEKEPTTPIGPERRSALLLSTRSSRNLLVDRVKTETSEKSTDQPEVDEDVVPRKRMKLDFGIAVAKNRTGLRKRDSMKMHAGESSKKAVHSRSIVNSMEKKRGMRILTWIKKKNLQKSRKHPTSKL